MQSVKAFAAGFLSTIIFHQSLLAMLHNLNMTSVMAFSFTPMPPFHVPQVISLAFWGGIWGILVWLVIQKMSRINYWLWALVLGAMAPSIVAWFIVFPLKGIPVAGGWQPQMIVFPLLLNGVWGVGVAFLIRSFNRSPIC
jgi:hypothetical protein